MKKIYQKPKTLTMKISTSIILTTSDPDVKVDKDSESVDAGSVDARRNNNVWDEEDEEEL